jgi:hypothetical protein
MKTLCFLLLCFIVCCTSEKKTEALATDSLKVDSVVAVEQTVENVGNTRQTEDSLSETFAVVSIGENAWLKEYIKSPFEGIGIDSIAGLLKSKSIEVKFQNGENGSIGFGNSSITFNRSYGDSYCLAKITSPDLPLGNGIAIGMSQDDFVKKVSFSPATRTVNQRFEFSDTWDEKTYVISFDFVNNLLVKFTYTTDPCVIYD